MGGLCSAANSRTALLCRRFFFFFYSSRRALMAYPLTFVVPAAVFHKQRMENILLHLKCRLCCSSFPATRHSARAQSHSPPPPPTTPGVEVLGFSLVPLIQVNSSPSVPLILCVMCNRLKQQCQHGFIFYFHSLHVELFQYHGENFFFSSFLREQSNGFSLACQNVHQLSFFCDFDKQYINEIISDISS